VPLDRHAKRFLERLAAVNPPSALSLSVAERREALRALLGFAAPPPALGRIEDRSCEGPGGPLPLRIYTPADADRGLMPGLVYFHGGGMVAGSVDTHDVIARSLCVASGWRLISVDYRLAPEARFPAALLDALAAASWVAAHADELGIDVRRLAVGGDSAGATLAAAVCQEAAAPHGPPLALQFLLCPILDYAGQTASRRALARGFLVDDDTLRHDLRHYLAGEGQAADPRVSPLRAAQLAGLPPACIHTAEFDPLRDEGRDYAARLTQAGVPVRYHCHAGMIHLFYGLGAVIPAAAAAYARMGADIRAMLAV
jgi:acetyl esterase/lipase